MNRTDYWNKVNWENLQVRKFWYPDCDVYEIPKMLPCTHIEVDRWVPFNMAKTVPMPQRQYTGIHFNIHDFQFERVWNYPHKSLELLRQFGAMTCPDFSIYNDFPNAVRIYNVYRNRWCARWWQENGLNVIPLIQYSRPDSFKWCFAGYPKDSIAMVSFVGNHISPIGRKKDQQSISMLEGAPEETPEDLGYERDPDETPYVRPGFDKFMKDFTPVKLLVYGRPFSWVYDYGVEVELIDSFTVEMKKRIKARKKEQKARATDTQISMFQMVEDSGIGSEE